ncbi:MAG TPA: hypothetical protein VF699_05120 [Caulobacteraceae bacterium]
MTAPLPAIGSVLPTPPAHAPVADSVWSAWTSRHRHSAAFRTARAALAALLQQRDLPRLWLPAYVCDTVAAAGAAGEIAWYPTDERLHVDAGALEADLQAGDAVLVVDYFGRSPPPAVTALAERRRDVLWIEDRAQALEPDSAAFGDVLLYSPRKLFGVADGGLLVSNEPLPRPSPDREDPELWAANDARAQDREGAHPGRWFPAFQGREGAFTIESKPMSGRARAVLEAMALAPEAATRRSNWRRLAEQLADYALWPVTEPAFAPMAFPVLVDHAGATAAAMAGQRVWCARHWSELPSPCGAFPEAHRLAERCLSLPLDGRYGDEDMDRAADALRRCARPAQPR